GTVIFFTWWWPRPPSRAIYSLRGTVTLLPESRLGRGAPLGPTSAVRRDGVRGRGWTRPHVLSARKEVGQGGMVDVRPGEWRARSADLRIGVLESRLNATSSATAPGSAAAVRRRARKRLGLPGFLFSGLLSHGALRNSLPAGRICGREVIPMMRAQGRRGAPI